MLLKNSKNIKFEQIVILISIFISIIWGSYNLNKFDKIKLNFEGKYYNQLLYHDLNNLWYTADKIRKDLKNEKGLINSIPKYDKWFLPSIIVGYYYHLIDKEIYQTMENGDIVIKEKNFKFPLLIFQILIYFSALALFFKEIKNLVNNKTFIVLVLFLCLEPSLLQWHSSFWSESLFLSFIILIFYYLIKKNKKLFNFFIIGILVGLMYCQRAVSFFYIIPLMVYFIIEYKKKFKNYFLLFVGYGLVVLTIGFINLKKTDNFHFFSQVHQYYSFYHYFAADILGDRKKISDTKAQELLDKNEKKWISDNKINLKKSSDYSRLIKYRNEIFLRESIKNPIYVAKKFIKKLTVMCIIHPFWVHNHFYIDKTDPEAKSNKKKYFNKNLYKNIPYSLLIQIIAIFGFLYFFYKIRKKKWKLNAYERFLIFNLLSIFYFIAVSGLWGNPKYFAPCMLSLSLFFSEGFNYISTRFFSKKYSIY